MTTYDKHPFVATGFPAGSCLSGWDAIASELKSKITRTDHVICIECYPGTLESEIVSELSTRLDPAAVILSSEAYRSESQLRATFDESLSEDPVFGYLSDATIADFLDVELVERLRARISQTEGIVLVVGSGAFLLVPHPSCLIYADMARWQIQLRQRKQLIGNLGISNLDARASEKYKRAFFLDWRAADRLKLTVLPQADYVIDTNIAGIPKMVAGRSFHDALRQVLRQPFRLVPFFDPGPWGGQWMREHFDLPRDTPNYAWCFDCVPEENSLILGFGKHRFETPAQNLVLFLPQQLMGEAVFNRFGRDFPIRFDLLDTMQGGNLSLQVHPLAQYIGDHFGMSYTQDESYYLLDAGSDAVVYLGLRSDLDPLEMESDLRRAQESNLTFPVEKYANAIPARKHDHFLIPAGTVHCSGANSMVLEISATPYIFTFKLWDWGRLGLDGRPRPIHIEDGMKNIQWDRQSQWVSDQLVNQVSLVAEGNGWREERTGLHELEFIDTIRHWFQVAVEHDTRGTVHVLNLVQGSGVFVESPSDQFPPFPVHYAETFIVPACIGRYTITPVIEGERCATIRANVR